jgi:hypothetical protein
LGISGVENEFVRRSLNHWIEILSESKFKQIELFRAAPGKKLVIADFSQMELVAAAVIAPEPIILDSFQNQQTFIAGPLRFS